MPQFFAQLPELLVVEVLVGLILTAAGAVFIKRIWEPGKRYWRARAWLNRAVSVGVRNFYPSRESYSTDRSLAFVDYIRSAKHELTYFGHWLAFTVEQHNTLEALVDHAKSGVRIRLVLLHEALSPDVLSTYARYFGEEEIKLRDEIAETWRRVRLAQRELGASEQSLFELRAHREFIPYSAFWFDPRHEGEHILIDMKLFASPRRHAYGIELHPQPSTSSRYPSLFERYADSLRRLQDLSGSPLAPSY